MYTDIFILGGGSFYFYIIYVFFCCRAHLFIRFSGLLATFKKKNYSHYTELLLKFVELKRSYALAGGGGGVGESQCTLSENISENILAYAI